MNYLKISIVVLAAIFVSCKNETNTKKDAAANNKEVAMVSEKEVETVNDGYALGDKAADIKLKNIDGKMVSYSDYPDAKGFIVIFTCNECPYAVASEDRIIALDKEFKTKGYPVIAINPNDAAINPSDSFSAMQQKAKDKSFTFPYLFDESNTVQATYGAKKTPHVYLLQNQTNGDRVVKYIGAIDDNVRDGSAVKERFVANAVNELLAGKEVAVKETKAIGCSVKQKKA